MDVGIARVLRPTLSGSPLGLSMIVSKPPSQARRRTVSGCRRVPAGTFFTGLAADSGVSAETDVPAYMDSPSIAVVDDAQWLDCSRISGLSVVRFARDLDGLFAR